MQSWQKSLMLAAMAGLVLLAFASDTSATPVSVSANISFVRFASLHKHSDITFGGLQGRPNDQVSVGTDGAMRLMGKGEVLTPFGHPAVITIGDAGSQLLNFSPGNYSPGRGVTALQARCVVKGVQRGDCDKLPVFGDQENTLFIGMDMTLGGDAASVDNDTPPSFDMSVVYQ
jgi:hypothetical protein